MEERISRHGNDQKHHKTRRWKWIGHVLRRRSNIHARTALDWTSEGRMKQRRPEGTWRRTVEREKKQLRLRSWNEATRKDRLE